MGKVIFVSGIDTDVGKTVATGIYAKKLMEQGFSVITQKMIQTGCKNIADDLLVHRKIQGIDLTAEDLQGDTCPYLFEYPCSPHLAAKLEGREINEKIIEKSTALLALSSRFTWWRARVGKITVEMAIPNNPRGNSNKRSE